VSRSSWNLKEGDFRQPAGYSDSSRTFLPTRAWTFLSRRPSQIMPPMATAAYRAPSWKLASGGKLYLAAYTQKLGLRPHFYDDDVVNFFSRMPREDAIFLVALGEALRSARVDLPSSEYEGKTQHETEPCGQFPPSLPVASSLQSQLLLSDSPFSILMSRTRHPGCHVARGLTRFVPELKEGRHSDRRTRPGACYHLPRKRRVTATRRPPGRRTRQPHGVEFGDGWFPSLRLRTCSNRGCSQSGSRLCPASFRELKSKGLRKGLRVRSQLFV